MNNPKLIASDVPTSIRPNHFPSLKEVPPIRVMLGTLGRMEWESLGARFIFSSQDAGHWVGVIHQEKAASKTDFCEMVEHGFLKETKVDKGWLYELSQLGIETIYVRYTTRIIGSLENQVRHLEYDLEKIQQNWFKRLLQRFA